MKQVYISYFCLSLVFEVLFGHVKMKLKLSWFLQNVLQETVYIYSVPVVAHAVITPKTLFSSGAREKWKMPLLMYEKEPYGHGEVFNSIFRLEQPRAVYKLNMRQVKPFISKGGWACLESCISRGRIRLEPQRHFQTY